jgi:HPt (histidine-containing phosphotransfer) domain-containing protein
LRQEFAVFNLEATLQRLAGDHELVRMLIRVFLDDAPVLLQQIRAMVLASQWPEAHRAAHSLRGLAANIEAGPVVDAAFAVEQLTGQPPPDEVLLRDRLADLELTVSRTLDALRSVSER